MRLNDLCKQAHDNAVQKGFWEDLTVLDTLDTTIGDATYDAFYQTIISTKLMLIVSELGEALEALRNDNIDNFKEELADVVIRLGDLCGAMGIDLENEVMRKMLINSKRGYKHGKTF